MNDTDVIESLEGTQSPRSRRILRRVLLGIGWTFVALVVVAGTLYAFGGMWVRTPEMRDAYEVQVDAGTVDAIDARFVIPIPGCVCHSEDPVLQAEHSVRRIRECSRCHAGR